MELISTDLMEIAFLTSTLVFTIVTISHWLACSFWIAGINVLSTSDLGWIRAMNLEDVSKGEQYVNSIYWAITTMVTVGYGDINPKTTTERIYTIVNMVVAAGTYAYTINAISSMVRTYNLLAYNYREKIKYVKVFLR